MRRLSSTFAICGALVAAAAICQDQVAPDRIDLDGHSWTLRGDWSRGEHLGRDAILMRNAVMRLDDTELANGTVEFDVAVTGLRSFVGVAFRLQEGGNYEDFYLRPHQSGRFDALQYTPVWNDVSAWQLYPEHNAAFDIPRDQWLHVRLEVRDGHLEAWLGDGERPVMVVERMAGPDEAGGVALKAFFPAAGETPGVYPAAFSGFRLTAGDPRRPRPVQAPPAADGTIARWEVSQSFAGSPDRIESYPSDLVESAVWTTVTADSEGRLNLAETAGIPAGEDTGLRLARVVLTSETARDVQLDFGASDRVSIFLGGRLLFTGDNTYLSRSQRYLGVMTLDNDSLRLGLVPGDNELLFVVSEAFGGWGLTGRLRAEPGTEAPPSRP